MSKDKTEDNPEFDLTKFDRDKFQPREEVMELEGLKDYFKKGKPIVKVRGLTINEYSKCREVNSNIKTIQALSNALLAQSGKEIKNSMEKLIGFSDDVPDDIKYRIQTMVFGIVEPKLERAHIVKLGNAFTTEFYLISNKIIELSSQGQEVMGKPTPSGKKTESKTA